MRAAEATTSCETLLPRVAVAYATVRPVAAPNARGRSATARPMATLEALETAHLVPAGLENGPTLVATPRAGIPTTLPVRRTAAVTPTPAGLPMASHLPVPSRAGAVGPVTITTSAEAGT